MRLNVLSVIWVYGKRRWREENVNIPFMCHISEKTLNFILVRCAHICLTIINIFLKHRLFRCSPHDDCKCEDFTSFNKISNLQVSFSKENVRGKNGRVEWRDEHVLRLVSNSVRSWKTWLSPQSDVERRREPKGRRTAFNVMRNDELALMAFSVFDKVSSFFYGPSIMDTIRLRSSVVWRQTRMKSARPFIALFILRCFAAAVWSALTRSLQFPSFNARNLPFSSLLSSSLLFVTFQPSYKLK